MPHYEARMSSKGEITVPAEVREFFDLKDGDLIDFYVDETARAVRILARNKKLSDLAGVLRTERDADERPLTPGDIDDSIGAHLAEKHERIRRQWDEWREFQEWRKARQGQAAE